MVARQVKVWCPSASVDVNYCRCRWSLSCSDTVVSESCPDYGPKTLHSDIRDGALFVAQNKTGAKRAIEIVGELAQLIDRSNERPRHRTSRS